MCYMGTRTELGCKALFPKVNTFLKEHFPQSKPHNAVRVAFYYSFMYFTPQFYVLLIMYAYPILSC